jgi:ribosomal protein S6
MNYELSFLTPNLTIEEKEKLLKSIESEIKELGGSVEEQFSEKKKFAYPVKKQKDGFLGIFTFSLNSQKIGKFKKSLNSNKNILREMIEAKLKIEKTEKHKRGRSKPEKTYETKKPIIKKKKAKIEDLEQKLEEILK